MGSENEREYEDDQDNQHSDDQESQDSQNTHLAPNPESDESSDSEEDIWAEDGDDLGDDGDLEGELGYGRF